MIAVSGFLVSGLQDGLWGCSFSFRGFSSGLNLSSHDFGGFRLRIWILVA